MSKAQSSVGLVIEWSPRRVLAFDVATRQVKSYPDAVGLPYGGRTALLAISRRSVFVRATRVPNAAPEDIRTVVQIKLAELFPVPPADLAFDFIMMPDLNQDGRLALIVAMPVYELRKAREQMAAAGIKISRVVPVAIGSTFLAESLSYKDAAIVEKTDDLASVDIIVDSLLRYSRVIPPGAPIDVEINRTFNVAGIPCTHIVAAGGAEVAEADATTKATALESLSGAWLDKIKLNLDLPEVIAQRELSERRSRQRLAVVMLLGAIALGGYVFSIKSSAMAEASAVRSRYARGLQDAQADAKKKVAESTRMTNIFQTLNVAFNPGQRLNDVLVDAANMAPDKTVWVTALALERGKPITIRGTALSNDGVKAYVDNLNHDPRFRNAKFVYATTGEVEKTPVVQFSITAFPNGNLPITLQQKAGVSSPTQ